MYPTPAKRLHVVQRSAANIRMLSGRGGIFQRLGLRNTQDVPFEEESRGDALVLNFKADSNNVLREPESTLMRTRAGQEDLRNQHAKGEGRRQGSRIRLCILILVGLGVLMKTGSVGRENDGTSKGQVSILNDLTWTSTWSNCLCWLRSSKVLVLQLDLNTQSYREEPDLAERDGVREIHVC